MYTAPFRYLRAANLAEAEALFAKTPEAKYLAGGQTIIPTMKLRLAAPAALIDISRIEELSFIRHERGAVIVGAGTRHADVAASSDARRYIPALAHVAGLIGDPAVRHKGTLGGSLANNDPAADYPAAVLALNATVKTTRREIPAEDFFTGMFQTALEDGELITQVSFPIPTRAGYEKFPNPASRYALVGVFVAQFEDSVMVAATGAAPCVFRLPEMERALGESFTADAVAGIQVEPDGLNSDLFGTAEYRAHLITVMAKRAVAASLGP
jgi:aerobic carbon-monoxide dehydrogenase medium subunit